MSAELSDEEILNALHMRDHEGLTYAEISKRMNGLSRSGVSGLFSRIEKVTDKHDLTPHLNGTLAPDWWKEGLRQR